MNACVGHLRGGLAHVNVMVSMLFAGGILPGILIGVSQMGYVSWKSRRDGMQTRPKADFGARKSAFYSAAPAMLMPLIILGGVTFGIATPTEASIIAVAYALLLGAVVYRKLSFRMLLQELVGSSKLVALSLFCLGSAALLGWLLAV